MWGGYGQGGWVAVEGSVQVGGNKEEMGTAKMGNHRNEGADLDGLRLQFEAVEGVDGFVCIVGVRVVHLLRASTTILVLKYMCCSE